METILKKMFFYRQFFSEFLYKYLRGQEEYEDVVRFEDFFDLLTEGLSEAQLCCLLYTLDALGQGCLDYLAIFLKTHPVFLSVLTSVFDEYRPTQIETQIRDWISHKKGDQDTVGTSVLPMVRMANAEDQTEFKALLEGCYVGLKKTREAELLIAKTHQRFGTSNFLMTKPFFSFRIRNAREVGDHTIEKEETHAFHCYQRAVVKVALYEWLVGVLSVTDSQGDTVLHHLCRKINISTIDKLAEIDGDLFQIINKNGEKPVDCMFKGWLEKKINEE